MIFVTTGNFDTGFDRLIQAVDALFEEGVLTGEGLAQIAGGSYEPAHMEWKRFLTPAEYDRAMAEATLVIGHAGAGTVRAAASHGTPLVIMPRRSDRKEHYNDHQQATGPVYAEKRLALLAADETELRACIAEAAEFKPAKPSEGGKVVELVRVFLRELAEERTGRC
ncbi:MAG: hypothetical protein KAS72_06095 [Phycisphaerales bacterium]|nr:hypothetical protein [Phycisphaerales bacterium]